MAALALAAMTLLTSIPATVTAEDFAWDKGKTVLLDGPELNRTLKTLAGYMPEIEKPDNISDEEWYGGKEEEARQAAYDSYTDTSVIRIERSDKAPEEDDQAAVVSRTDRLAKEAYAWIDDVPSETFGLSETDPGVIMTAVPVPAEPVPAEEQKTGPAVSTDGTDGKASGQGTEQMTDNAASVSASSTQSTSGAAPTSSTSSVKTEEHSAAENTGTQTAQQEAETTKTVPMVKVLYLYSEGDIYAPADFQDAFKGFQSLNAIDGLAGIDLSHAEDMTGLFKGDLSIGSYKTIDNWNVKKEAKADDIFPKEEDYTSAVNAGIRAADYSKVVLPDWYVKRQEEKKKEEKEAAEAKAEAEKTAEEDRKQEADAVSDAPAEENVTASSASSTVSAEEPTVVNGDPEQEKKNETGDFRLIVRVEEGASLPKGLPECTDVYTDTTHILSFKEEKDRKAAEGLLKEADGIVSVEEDAEIAIASPEEEGADAGKDKTAAEPNSAPVTENNTESTSADSEASEEVSSASNVGQDDAADTQVDSIPLEESVDTEKDLNTADKTRKEELTVALVDTGVNDGLAYESVDFTGEGTQDDNGHGTKMANTINKAYGKNARILSLKALGKDGKGDTSSVVKAIAYAIEQKADIINLSISKKDSGEDEGFVEIIKEAVDAGITVVAAAGNNGSDVKDYIPGNIEEVVTVGACNADGNMMPVSNYGKLVDIYAVAGSTSEAAAEVTGYFLKNGINAEADNETVFTKEKIKKAEENEYSEGKEQEPNDKFQTAGGTAVSVRGTTGEATTSYPLHDDSNDTYYVTTSDTRWFVENPNSHDAVVVGWAERSSLVAAGWHDRGPITFGSSSFTAFPVYRFYSSSASDYNHYYSRNPNPQSGYQREGSGFYEWACYVSYDRNGGSGWVPNTGYYRYTEGVTLSGTHLTKTGYTQTGWNYGSFGQYKGRLTEYDGQSISITAQWQANTTKVTLDQTGNGGKGSGVDGFTDEQGTGGSSSVTATYDSAMPKITPPTMPGWTFEGYYDAKDGGNKYYNADGTSARTWNKDVRNATLYAHWKQNKCTYTFNLNIHLDKEEEDTAQGGTRAGYHTMTMNAEKGQPFNTAAEFSNAGTAYTAEGGENGYNASDQGDHSDTYTTTTYYSYRTILPTAYADAYEFLGWFDKPVGGNFIGGDFPGRSQYTPLQTYINHGVDEKYKDYNQLETSRTYYAHWKPKEYMVHYSWTGGSAPAPDRTYNVEETPDWVPRATDDNSVIIPKRGDLYTFAGWKSEGPGQSLNKAKTDPTKEASLKQGTTGDVYLTALWKPNIGEGFVNLSNGGTPNLVESKDNEGIFKITEITSTDGYIKDGESRLISIAEDEDGSKKTELNAAGEKDPEYTNSQDKDSKYYDQSDDADVKFNNTPNKLVIYKYDLDTDEPLPGAQFSVTKKDDPNMTFEVETGDDGTATLERLEPGYWIIKETKAPLDKDGRSYQIVGNGTKEIEVTKDIEKYAVSFPNNQHISINTGILILEKTDETGRAVSGVSFRIWNDSGYEKTIVTNNQGIATVRDLEVGSYHYQEIASTVPKGYIADQNIYDVTITESPDGIIRTVGNTSITNYPNRITFKKTDENGNVLKGAEFTFTFPDGTVVKKTASDGTVTLEKLSKGTYRYEETKSPTGYIQDTSVHSFTVGDDGRIKVDDDTVSVSQYAEDANGTKSETAYDAENGVGECIIRMKNTRNHLSLTKKNENGQPLEGATYRIWCEANGFDESLTTDGNGKLTVDGLMNGTYFVKEITAPYGYYVEDKTDIFTVEDDRTMSYNGKKGLDTVALEYTDTVNGLVIHKTDTSNEAKPIKGAVYTFTYQGPGTDPFGNGIMTTDEKGEISVSALPPGNYTFKETSAPNDYRIDHAVHTFTVSSDGSISSADTKMTRKEDGKIVGLTHLFITDQKIVPDRIRITKYEDETALYISGAEFTVTQYDKGTDSYVAMEDGGVLTEDVDDPGHYSYAGLMYTEQNGGKFRVTETKAPAGYSTNFTRDFEIDTEHTEEEHLIEMTASNTPNEFVLKKRDDYDEALEGAVFHFDYEGKGIDPFAGNNEISTDADGEIHLTRLPEGTYTYYEVRTPDDAHYYKDENTYSFKVDGTGKIGKTLTVTKDGKTSTKELRLENTGSAKKDENGSTLASASRAETTCVNVYVPDLHGIVKIKKTDKEGYEEGNLHGALFSIYEYSGKNDADGKPIYETEVLTEMTEDPDRKGYTSPKLEYTKKNHGMFRIVETTPPSGYVAEWQTDICLAKYADDKDKKSNPDSMMEEDIVMRRLHLSMDSETRKLPNGLPAYTDKQDGEDHYLTFTNEKDLEDAYKLASKADHVTVCEYWAAAGDGEQLFNFDAENQRNEFRIRKTDGKGKALEGAVFRLTRDSDGDLIPDTHTETVKDGNGNDTYVERHTMEPTSGADGYVKWTNLAAGEYTLTEIKGVDGYMRDKTEHKASVKKDGTISYDGNPAAARVDGEFVNEPLTYTIRKVDWAGLQGGTPTLLKGAKFAIWSDGINAKTIEVTLGDGTYSLKDLTYGTWYYRELQAPAGYYTDTTVHTLTVTEDGITEETGDKFYADITNPQNNIMRDIVNAKEQPGVPGKVSLKKTDENGTALTGAEFKIYAVNEVTVIPPSDPGGDENEDEYKGGVLLNTDLSYEQVMEKGTFAADMTLGADGYYHSPELPADGENKGVYYILETKSPDGHQGQWKTRVTVLPENHKDIIFDADHLGNVINEKTRIKIRKTDSITGEPVAGATYTVWEDGKEETKTDFTTDADGILTIDGFVPDADGNKTVPVKNDTRYRYQEKADAKVYYTYSGSHEDKENALAGVAHEYTSTECIRMKTTDFDAFRNAMDAAGYSYQILSETDDRTEYTFDMSAALLKTMLTDAGVSFELTAGNSVLIGAGEESSFEALMQKAGQDYKKGKTLEGETVVSYEEDRVKVEDALAAGPAYTFETAEEIVVKKEDAQAFETAMIAAKVPFTKDKETGTPEGYLTDELVHSFDTTATGMAEPLYDKKVFVGLHTRHIYDEERQLPVEGGTYSVKEKGADDSTAVTYTSDASGYITVHDMKPDTDYIFKEVSVPQGEGTAHDGGYDRLDLPESERTFRTAGLAERKDKALIETQDIPLSYTGQLRIHKYDLDDVTYDLPGAQFAIYEWNRQTQSYSDTPYPAKVTWQQSPPYTDENKGYYVSDILPITDQNEGKFRVKEISYPEDYGPVDEGAAWEDTFVLNKEEAGTSVVTFQVPNEVLDKIYETKLTDARNGTQTTEINKETSYRPGTVILDDKLALKLPKDKWYYLKGYLYVKTVTKNKDGEDTVKVEKLLDKNGEPITSTPKVFRSVPVEQAKETWEVRRRTKTYLTQVQHITYEFDLDDLPKGYDLEGKTLVAYDQMFNYTPDAADPYNISLGTIGRQVGGIREDRLDRPKTKEKFEIAARNIEQTVRFPKIETVVASDHMGEGADGGQHVGEGVEDDQRGIDGSFTDTIRFWNLIPGETYTITGKLMERNADGTVKANPMTDASGRNVEATVVFRIDSEDELYVNYNKSKETLQNGTGMVTVLNAYTSADDGKTKNRITPDDIKWTLEVYDDCHTKAETGKSCVETKGGHAADGTITLPFRFDYSKVTGLIPQDEFDSLRTEEEKSGRNAEMALNDDLYFEGRTAVVYERLYAGAQDHADSADKTNDLAAAHTEPLDEDQVLYFPKVETEASTAGGGQHQLEEDEDGTVKDTVKLSNLVPGQTYTVRARLMIKKLDDKGRPYVISAGKLLNGEGTDKLTVSKTFTTGEKETEKTVELELKTAPNLLEGDQLVVFEDLLNKNGQVVAAHHDANDRLQQIMTRFHTVLINTGGQGYRYLMYIGLAVLALAAVLIAKTKKKKKA